MSKQIRAVPISKTRRTAEMRKVARKVVDKKLKSIQELKYHPFTANTTLDENGTVTSLTTIAQGDTDSTRNGDEIFIKYMNFNWSCIQADATNLVRCLLFVWKETSTPTVGAILDSAVATSEAPLYTYNNDARSRFTVLYDSGPISVTSAGPSQRVFKKFIKVNKPVHFSGGGTVGQNKIYILGISDSSAVTHPTFRYNGKLRFTDS